MHSEKKDACKINEISHQDLRKTAIIIGIICIFITSFIGVYFGEQNIDSRNRGTLARYLDNYKDGEESGYDFGYPFGYREGYDKGYSDGFNEGLKETEPLEDLYFSPVINGCLSDWNNSLHYTLNHRLGTQHVLIGFNESNVHIGIDLPSYKVENPYAWVSTYFTNTSFSLDSFYENTFRYSYANEYNDALSSLELFPFKENYKFSEIGWDLKTNGTMNQTHFIPALLRSQAENVGFQEFEGDFLNVSIQFDLIDLYLTNYPFLSENQLRTFLFENEVFPSGYFEVSHGLFNSSENTYLNYLEGSTLTGKENLETFIEIELESGEKKTSEISFEISQEIFSFEFVINLTEFNREDISFYLNQINLQLPWIENMIFENTSIIPSIAFGYTEENAPHERVIIEMSFPYEFLGIEYLNETFGIFVMINEIDDLDYNLHTCLNFGNIPFKPWYSSSYMFLNISQEAKTL